MRKVARVSSIALRTLTWYFFLIKGPLLFMDWLIWVFSIIRRAVVIAYIPSITFVHMAQCIMSWRRGIAWGPWWWSSYLTHHLNLSLCLHTIHPLLNFHHVLEYVLENCGGERYIYVSFSLATMFIRSSWAIFYWFLHWVSSCQDNSLREWRWPSVVKLEKDLMIFLTSSCCSSCFKPRPLILMIRIFKHENTY